MKWQISDQDIEATEKILLPEGAHFPEDARNVIRCWYSTDVVACPGSGKTTILLAKLKFLADRMPLENGSGICVLSHTNVAVNEIRKRLAGYTDKLLCYPNYIGTIQSFIDKFVTKPYLKNTIDKDVEVVDDLTFAQHMLDRMQRDTKYKDLNFVTKNSFKNGRQFTERLEHTQALHIRDDGGLYVGGQRKVLAKADKKSTIQFDLLIQDILMEEGIIRYKDAYSYAKSAIEKNLSKEYIDLFSTRFQYVFVDEYQDCDIVQRKVIDLIFKSGKCVLIKIGDPDQAIYNSSNDKIPDWVPDDNHVSISTSFRYSQEIAKVICNLKLEDKNIDTSSGNTGVKPVLLVFESKSIDKVVNEFINVLDRQKLLNDKGIYKAIGAVKNENSAGLKIGSYWKKFDGSVKKKSEHNYWGLLDKIINELSEGKLYKAEYYVRKLLFRVFHYAKIKNNVSEKEFSVTAIKKFLDQNEYRDMYREWIYNLSRMQNIERKTIHDIMCQNIKNLLKIMNFQTTDITNCIPEHFFDEGVDINQRENYEKNIFIDPIRGRRVEFDTIHGVKGETHDATLYLETERQNGSDLNRILPYYGIGQPGKSDLYDYSRKLAYVGMSRPKKLLCVAMQSKTYERCKDVFSDDWEIIDLRE